MTYIYLGVHAFTILMNGVSYMVSDLEVYCNILLNVVTFSGVVAQKLSALYIFKRAYDYYTQSKVSRRLQYHIHESRHGQRCCSAYNPYIINTSKRVYY